MPRVGQGGKETTAVERESSFLLEEEAWHLPRKAGVDWAACTKQAAVLQKRQSIPLFPLQTVCNQAAKYIPFPATVHKMKGRSYAGRFPHDCGWGGAGVIETSACAPSCAPAWDADPAWEFWQ